MKVALVYDRVNKWGGAERILLALNKIFPEAHLFTSVVNIDKAPWATKFKKIQSSFLQQVPFAKSFHQGFALFMPIAFESFNFDEYDLVVTLTSEAAKGIVTKPGTRHVCICLTPTRYLWSGYNDYFGNGLFRTISKPAVSYLRNWDKIAAQRPDSYIAISNEVKSRIRKYYGKDATVVYPPISLEAKDQLHEGNSNSFFLVVSRLVPYKRVDLAIKACNKLKLPLKIVGEGSQYLRLRLIAGKTVEFLGKLTDSELSAYYKNCRALIFPGVEDFGLVMAEAQSFGKPVIALRAGGALDIIKEGKTGEFFDKQDVESLVRVLANFDDKRYNSALCLENSQRFSLETFKKRLLQIIETL